MFKRTTFPDGGIHEQFMSNLELLKTSRSILFCIFLQFFVAPLRDLKMTKLLLLQDHLKMTKFSTSEVFIVPTVNISGWGWF